MGDEDSEQGRLSDYSSSVNKNQPAETEESSGKERSTEFPEEGGSEISEEESLKASRWVETLRARAIEDEWHLQQGKGKSSEEAIEQDLLAHTMDVVHITFNIADGMQLINDPPLDVETILTTAFLHDLHKRPEVGSTVKMKPEEVEEILTTWNLRDDVLDRISLHDLTDVLKSIHQFHGDNDSRAAIHADRELLLLTNIVRLADMVASVGRLDELWNGGPYQDPFEPLDTLSDATSAVDQGYTLGYHRLSTVRPALSSLVHEALYRELEAHEAILLATRADAAIYAIPESTDLVNPDSSVHDGQLLEEVVQRIRENLFSPEIRDAIPDKLQKELYGLEGAVELRADEQRQALIREEDAGHDIASDVRAIAQDLDDRVSASYDVEVVDGDDNRDEVDIIDIDAESETIWIEHESTAPGEIIGETLDQMMDAIGGEEERFVGVDSRLDTLGELAGDEINIGQFQDVYWQRIGAQLARIIGNHLESMSDDSAEVIIDTIEQRATNLVTAESDDADEDQDRGGLTTTLRNHIKDTVEIHIHHEEDTLVPTRVELPREVNAGLDYNECCVLCGSEASTPFRTTGYGEFKKSYLARGEAGKDMTDSENGAWHLCEICFLDNALFRASAGDVSQLRDIENALFLKVVPNRYLGPAQVALLRNRFREGSAFGRIAEDAERHLKSEYDLAEEETQWIDLTELEVPSLGAEYRVDFTGPSADQTGTVIGSPHFFIIAVEDDDDSPTKQTTNTWLRAILRALILSRYHNLAVVVDGQPTMSPDDYQMANSGVRLNNPPSQIRSVFDDSIPYRQTDTHLTGLSALIYAEDTLPQYQPEGRGSYGPDYLSRAYDLFRGSVLPGARMYRASEREYDLDIPAGDYVDDAGLIAQLLNEWRDRSGLDEDSTVTASNAKTTHDQNE